MSPKSLQPNLNRSSIEGGSVLKGCGRAPASRRRAACSQKEIVEFAEKHRARIYERQVASAVLLHAADNSSESHWMEGERKEPVGGWKTVGWGLGLGRREGMMYLGEQTESLLLLALTGRQEDVLDDL